MYYVKTITYRNTSTKMYLARSSPILNVVIYSTSRDMNASKSLKTRLLLRLFFYSIKRDWEISLRPSLSLNFFIFICKYIKSFIYKVPPPIQQCIQYWQDNRIYRAGHFQNCVYSRVPSNSKFFSDHHVDLASLRHWPKDQLGQIWPNLVKNWGRGKSFNFRIFNRVLRRNSPFGT